MRTPIRFIVCACITLFALHSTAWSSNFVNAEDTTKKYFVSLKCLVKENKKGLENATVSIYLDSSAALLKKVKSDANGIAEFIVPLQQFYTIKVSKKGYLTKIVTIDTKMPKAHYVSDYSFEFSVDMLVEVPGLDASILKYPVSKIFFNTFTKKFDYDFNYIVKILKDLKKFYDNHKLLSKTHSSPVPSDTSKVNKK